MNIQLSTQTHEIWYAGYSCGTINYSKKKLIFLHEEVLRGVKEARLNLQLSTQTREFWYAGYLCGSYY